jgi:arginine decarboxylase
LPDQLTAALQEQPGLDITVRSGTGTARTLLSAFDSALMSAGVANFNLITLS